MPTYTDSPSVKRCTFSDSTCQVGFSPSPQPVTVTTLTASTVLWFSVLVLQNQGTWNLDSTDETKVMLKQQSRSLFPAPGWWLFLIHLESFRRCISSSLLLSKQQSLYQGDRHSVVVTSVTGNNVMRREGRAGICRAIVCNANNINHSPLLTSVCISLCGFFFYVCFTDVIENVSQG